MDPLACKEDLDSQASDNAAAATVDFPLEAHKTVLRGCKDSHSQASDKAAFQAATTLVFLEALKMVAFPRDVESVKTMSLEICRPHHRMEMAK